MLYLKLCSIYGRYYGKYNYWLIFTLYLLGNLDFKSYTQSTELSTRLLSSVTCGVK